MHELFTASIPAAVDQTFAMLHWTSIKPPLSCSKTKLAPGSPFVSFLNPFKLDIPLRIMNNLIE